ncbi:hypothetical protein HDE_12378 [Halotydeus destructor]|nr:hypothetical protein HDE_12378 [Halotydeus destructor]
MAVNLYTVLFEHQLCLVISLLLINRISGSDMEFSDNYSSEGLPNETECTSSCSFLGELGPPPDMILSMPPPPLPPFMQHILAENFSSLMDSDGNCNLCHIFANRGVDSEYTLPNPETTVSKSWFTFVLTSTGCLILTLILVAMLIKCRKGKFDRMTDICPGMHGTFIRSQKASPPVCSPADSCISPVVNEKSPQSIITSAPNKKSTVSTKYWRRADFDGRSSQNYADGGETDENYACAEGGSCTSSPVYAELDGCVTQIQPGQLLGPHGGSILISGPSRAISPYSVGLHTYSEVPEAMRMAALGSSAALLPDTSYDNAAYLPTAAAIDHYNASRSLRRGHRGATLAQLGSATPLLNNTHAGNAYLTAGRPSKKPRPPFPQQLARGSLQRIPDDIDNSGQPRYASRGNPGHYGDLPIRQSPSLTTFKAASASPFTYKDNPKRPLPPVPGVRL